ncbi:MAG: apolipoprotein N-acyltransferase [Rickettsiales bacterium]|jgi:apolipoprotein N-acyltransferase|nr:apolipoprotein N-acyltransferase [Rickettsiales bacterium]
MAKSSKEHFPVWNKVGLFFLGALGALGFAPHYLWPATVVSIGAAYYLLKDKGFRYSFWWGAGYAAANFYWCFLYALDGESWHLYFAGTLGWMLVVGPIFATPFAMTSATKAAGWRRTLYFALACAFTLWLREWIYIAPWNPLANITMPNLRLSNSMSLVGALGLTFVLAGCIASVPEYIQSKSKWQFLFFVPLLLLWLSYDKHEGIESGKTVRLVNPAFSRSGDIIVYHDEGAYPGPGYDDFQPENKDLNKLMDLSAAELDFPPDLIVWPETAYPRDADMTTMFPALGTALALGAVYRENGKSYNSLLYAGKDGRIVDMYHKVHLVPFGEYDPFLGLGPSSGIFSRGKGPKIIDDFAPSICYDIAYSDTLIPKGQNGRPKYILNLTSDAWFGNTGGLYQHLDMIRRQAIETGLPVVSSNYNGISAIVSNQGVVLKSFPYGRAGFIDSVIPPHKITPYRKIGLNGIMLALAVLSGLILIIFRKKKLNYLANESARTRPDKSL